jgi:hypothetical protein
MDRPPIQLGLSELVLNSSEVAKLGFATKARQIAQAIGPVKIESEKITFDENFGYIFRYDIIKFVEEDGTFHPEAGMKGTIHKIESKIMVLTKNGQQFESILIPLSNFLE